MVTAAFGQASASGVAACPDVALKASLQPAETGDPRGGNGSLLRRFKRPAFGIIFEIAVGQMRKNVRIVRQSFAPSFKAVMLIELRSPALILLVGIGSVIPQHAV